MKQNESDVQKKPNPWLGMWLRPKQTVMASKHTFTISVFLLIWILGIHLALSYAREMHATDFQSLGYTLGISLLRAVFYGAFIWIIYSAFTLWLGRLFGGKGTWRTAGHAMALAQVPMLGYLIVYWPLALTVFGKELFSSEDVSLEPWQMLLNLVAMIISLVLGIWYIVTISKAIAGAHRFSSWKGFFTFLAMMVIVFIILLIVQLIG